MGEPNTKEKNFEIAKMFIDKGEVKSLVDLYNYIPKKTVAEGLGYNPSSFSNYKSEKPLEFKLKDILLLAKLIGVEHGVMIEIFMGPKTKKK